MLTKFMQGKWWVLLLRGILAIVLGLIAIANLEGTALVLYLWLGLYVIADGLLKGYQALFRRGPGQNPWPGLISGAASLILGALIFAWPGLTAVILIALLATHAIIQGVSDLVAASRAREEVSKAWFWLTLIGGGGQVLFGIWMIFQPLIGGLALIAVIAIYAVMIGVILILQGIQERSGGPPSPLAPA